MTTLVIGANGLVGSRIAARLAGSGERVVAVGRGERRVDAPVEYAAIDLSSELGRLAELIGSVRPSGVINAAAMTDVDACETSPREAWAMNVRVVEVVALAAASVGARLTTLSTDYVFDGTRGSYAEDDVPNPRGVYARTKRAADAAVCRVAVIYSGRKGAKKSFAVSAADSLASGRPVKAFVDQVVSPTLADNAAELVIGVHRSGAQGLFHCSGATEISRLEFCRAIARMLGADESLIVPVRLPRPEPTW